MKSLLLSLLLAFFGSTSISQTTLPEKKASLDSLVAWVSRSVRGQITDSTGVLTNAYNAVKLSEEKRNKELLAVSYSNLAIWHKGNTTTDSSIWYLKQTVGIYEELKNDKLLAGTYLDFEDVYKQAANYSEALSYDFKALDLFDKIKDQPGIATCYARLCDLMYYQEKYADGADYCQKAIDIQKGLNLPDELAISYRYKADNLLIIEKYDEALLNINEALSVLEKAGKGPVDLMPAHNTRGNIYKYLKRYDEALAEYKNNYTISKETNTERYLVPSLGNIGHVYRLQKNYAAALPYILEAISIIKKTGNTQNLWENYMHAADSYEALGQYDKALRYHRLFADERLDSKDQTIKQLESELQIKYETAKKDETIEEQDAQILLQKKNQLFYLSIAGLLAIILFGMYFTMRSIRKKRKALNELNIELEQKQKDLETSNEALTHSIEELKTTQDQLIQSEKMASLGELTAGIAHEIQNPLNFVNNFSELNKELIDELNVALKKGDTEEVIALAKDIAENEQKINHHGKRADSIVKGMLQHSRSSIGVKEPTDINKLTDEYLRLAYHGLRAKDKSFNASIKADLDETLGNINIVPQDIGRAILNLITNAFYAIDEKKRALPIDEAKNYDPTVTVSTKQIENKVEIRVKDNGTGIPRNVQAKIFEPFFTTKPTGKGTGLGLSMTYDIITKGHGGELKIDSKENEGAEFIIILNI